MRALRQAFNIESWPLWAKLSAAFTVAIVVPLALLLLFTQTGLRDVNAQRLQAFVAENGTRQQETINAALAQARNAVERFAADYDRQITPVFGALPAGDVVFALQDNLLASGVFRQARILNGAGDVLLQVTLRNVLPVGSNEADSLAVREASGSPEQPLTVVVTPGGTVEFTHALYRQDAVVGYLIVTLDEQVVLLDNLVYSANVYAAYSFLVTAGEQSVVIARDENRATVEQTALGSVAVARALGGVADAGSYSVGPNRNQPMLGYFAPVRNPADPRRVLFALVAEAPVEGPLAQILSYLGGARAFVLVVGAGLVLTVLVLLLNQLILPPLTHLRRAMQALTQGDFNAPVPITRRRDEFGDLSRTFVDMRGQLKLMVSELEGRIAARARDISATQEVSRFAANQRDLQTLLDQVVELIVKQFPNIYHTQIFLLDADGVYAVLRASTGQAGQALLKRGHRLAVGSLSVIGQTTLQGEVVIARDTATSQVHQVNEFLPYTRSEAAIPLRVGDTIIGALDVQSRGRDTFTPDEIVVLRTMADQIAVAIENARLYQESLSQLREIEAARRRAVAEDWREYIYARRERALVSQAGMTTGNDISALRQQAISQGRVAVGSPTRTGTVPIAVPIQVGGQTLGAVEWELPADQVDENRLQLAQELTNRLAISLDNARLFEESQRAAERERLVNAIAGKLTPQTEIEAILQLAAREVGQALRAPRVTVQLNTTRTNGNGNGDSHSSPT